MSNEEKKEMGTFNIRYTGVDEVKTPIANFTGIHQTPEHFLFRFTDADYRVGDERRIDRS